MLNSNEEDMSFIIALDNLLKFDSESLDSFSTNIRTLLSANDINLDLIEILKKDLNLLIEKNVVTDDPRFPIQSAKAIIAELEIFYKDQQYFSLMRVKFLFIGYAQLQIKENRVQAKAILDSLVEKNYLDALIFKLSILTSESYFSNCKYIDIEQDYCNYKYDKGYNLLVDSKYLIDTKNFFHKGSVMAGIDLKIYFLRNDQKLIVAAYEPTLKKMLDKNTDLVLTLLQNASKLGHVVSSHDLAEIYLNGCSSCFHVLVSQDIQKAISYLSTAIQQGQIEDVLNLVYIYLGERFIRKIDYSIKLPNSILINNSAYILIKNFRNINEAIRILEQVLILRTIEKYTNILSLCAFELAEIYRSYEESGTHEYRLTRICVNYELSMHLGNHLAGIRLALLHLTGYCQLEMPSNLKKCDELLLEIVDSIHIVNKKANMAYQIANELDKLNHIEKTLPRYLFWIFKSFDLGLHDKSIQHLVIRIAGFTQNQKNKLDLINQWQNFSAKIEEEETELNLDNDNENTGDDESSEREAYLELKNLTYNFFNINLANDSEMTIEEYSTLSFGM